MAERNARRSSVLMSERVFQRLEDEILERVRPPGTRLVEEAIAEEFHVSRTPVREALRTLHRAGWLDLHPNTGAYVRRPTLDEARDVFDLREVLEREAAAFAARRGSGADKLVLQDVVERGFAAVERGELKALIGLNTEFHQTLATVSGNALLRRFLDELEKQVRWHFAAVARLRANASWTEHREIVAAIDAGDDGEAARLAAWHCRRTQQAYIEQFLATDRAGAIGR